MALRLPLVYDGSGQHQQLQSTDALVFSSTVLIPILLVAKSQAITTGVAQDIVTLTLPTGISRWYVQGNSALSSCGLFVNETQAGTMAAGTVAAFDAAGGGGNQLFSTTAPAATSNPTANSWLVPGAVVMSTSSTLVIRQMAASANTGTISFYIRIYPIP